MWEIWGKYLLPKALKSCPKSNLLPNLVSQPLTYLPFSLPSIKYSQACFQTNRQSQRTQSQCDQIGRFFYFLGKHSKPAATNILPKLPALLSNFCKEVKSIHFYSEIIFGQLIQTFGDFFWSHCLHVSADQMFRGE